MKYIFVKYKYLSVYKKNILMPNLFKKHYYELKNRHEMIFSRVPESLCDLCQIVCFPNIQRIQ